MPDITITVRDKIATAEADAAIVCGNNDYTIRFDLDAEWNAYEIKTMRVTWIDTFAGTSQKKNIVFTGLKAELPAIADAYEVMIGIYAGNLHTSTEAKIPCKRCITDGGTYHEEPSSDVYAQLLEKLEEISSGGGDIPTHDDLALAGLDETSIDDVDDWTTAE